MADIIPTREAPPVMKKRLLRIIVPLIFVLMLCQAATATFAHQIFGAFKITGFERLHVYPGYALVVLVLIHAWLNWDWLENSYFSQKRHTAPTPPPTSEDSAVVDEIERTD
jgi:hypothetical protein